MFLFLLRQDLTKLWERDAEVNGERLHCLSSGHEPASSIGLSSNLFRLAAAAAHYASRQIIHSPAAADGADENVICPLVGLDSV